MSKPIAVSSVIMLEVRAVGGSVGSHYGSKFGSYGGNVIYQKTHRVHVP